MAQEPVPQIQHIKYECTRCGEACPRGDLMAKRVRFAKIGGSVARQRTVDWLCPKCVSEDPDWNRPERSASPGMAGTHLTGAQTRRAGGQG